MTIDTIFATVKQFVAGSPTVLFSFVIAPCPPEPGATPAPQVISGPSVDSAATATPWAACDSTTTAPNVLAPGTLVAIFVSASSDATPVVAAATVC